MDDVSVYQVAVNVDVVPDVFASCVAVRLLVENISFDAKIPTWLLGFIRF